MPLKCCFSAIKSTPVAYIVWNGLKVSFVNYFKKKKTLTQIKQNRTVTETIPGQDAFTDEYNQSSTEEAIHNTQR